MHNIDVEIQGYTHVFSMHKVKPWEYVPSGRDLSGGDRIRYSLLYVWEGSYYAYQPDGECRFVPAHSLILIRRGRAPYHNTSAELPCRMTNIGFFTRNEIPINMPDNERFVFTPDVTWGVEEKYATAIQLYEERPVGWKMKLRNIISDLLLCILMQYYEQNQRPAVPKLISDSAALIRREIFTSPLSVSDVAQRCHVTPTYLIRTFSRCMGMTPKKYMDTLRVERACELLKYTDKSIDEVAEASGFSEARQMRRIFREIAGMTPREYRRQM